LLVFAKYNDFPQKSQEIFSFLSALFFSFVFLGILFVFSLTIIENPLFYLYNNDIYACK